MERLGKAMEMGNRLINSNSFINICLFGCFGVLGLRSLHQQDLILSLEADNEKIRNTNKSLKKSMWDCKQQLYADASSPDTAVVPLSRLMSIYGDVLSPPPSSGITPPVNSGSSETLNSSGLGREPVRLPVGLLRSRSRTWLSNISSSNSAMFLVQMYCFAADSEKAEELEAKIII